MLRLISLLKVYIDLYEGGVEDMNLNNPLITQILLNCYLLLRFILHVHKHLSILLLAFHQSSFSLLLIGFQSQLHLHVGLHHNVNLDFHLLTHLLIIHLPGFQQNSFCLLGTVYLLQVQLLLLHLLLLQHPVLHLEFHLACIHMLYLQYHLINLHVLLHVLQHVLLHHLRMMILKCLFVPHQYPVHHLLWM
jgi:hypothetical protein